MVVRKIEEYLLTNEERLWETLEKYPAEKSIFVDYNQLKEYDSDLAANMINNPEEMLNAFSYAIENIDPLSKCMDINIRIKNCCNHISLKDLNNSTQGELFYSNVIITKISEITPLLKTVAFECRNCMRVQEVEQYVGAENVIEPSLCSECGGRHFRLLHDESKFVDYQIITVREEGTNKKFNVKLLDDLCSVDEYFEGQQIGLTGFLKIIPVKDGFKNFIVANHIKKINDQNGKIFSFDLKEDGKRQSTSEDKEWRKKVIDRDSVCQCCGGEKHLEAHHIFGYKNNPHLRLDVNNGITLCTFCHKKYHSYYGLGDANPVDLVRFMNRFRR